MGWLYEETGFLYEETSWNKFMIAKWPSFSSIYIYIYIMRENLTTALVALKNYFDGMFYFLPHQMANTLLGEWTQQI